MDVIELPPPAETPPDTDVVDLGNGNDPPQIIPKRQQTLDSQQHMRLMQRECYFDFGGD